MARNVYRVDPKDNHWLISRMGDVAVELVSFGTKQDAVSGGRLLALRRLPSRLIVHTEDGKVETESRFGAD
ncbi:MAG: DUF2188 domain-containing protein [bacterium]